MLITSNCLIFSYDTREAVEILNQSLTMLKNGVCGNRLKCNPDKKKVLLVGKLILEYICTGRGTNEGSCSQ